MTPLEAFGLPAEADERAVKREYARRLKGARPDDDADAFQALQAAYAAALEWVRNPVRFEDFEFDDEEPEVAETAGGVTHIGLDVDALMAQFRTDRVAERLAEDAYDADALFDVIVDHGRRDDVAGLRAMLANDPELWSLDRKTWLRDALMERLEGETPPMSGTAFDVVADFFQMDASTNQYEAWRRLRLRQRMHVAHVLDGGTIPFGARWKRHVLLHSRSAWQRQLFALIPFVPTYVRAYLHGLDEGRIDDLPPPIAPAAAAFWDKAGDLGQVSLVRFGIGASRLLAFVSITFVVARLLADASAAVAMAAGVALCYVLLGAGSALFSWLAERNRRNGVTFNWWWVIWLLMIVGNAVRHFVE